MMETCSCVRDGRHMLLLPVFRDDGDMFLSLSGMADTCCCCPREECRAVVSACIRDCRSRHTVVACITDGRAVVSACIRGCRDTLLLPVSRMAEP